MSTTTTDESIFSEAIGIRKTVKWTILNWDLAKKVKGMPLESPPFQVGTFNWKLKVFPKGTEDSDGNFSFSVECDARIECASIRIDIGGWKTDAWTMNDKKIDEPDIWFWEDPDLNAFVPENNEFTFLLEFKHHSDVKNLMVEPYRPSAHSFLPNLVVDLERLRNDSSSYDVLFLVGGDEVRAHRVIVTLRSAVFAALFRQPLLDSLSGEIIIDGIRPAVFRSLIQFIYTATCGMKSDEEPTAMHKRIQGVEVDMEFVSDLLVAADRYQISGLVIYCGSFLLQSLNYDNVVRLFHLADMTNCNILRQGCISFMTKDKARLTQLITDESVIKILTKEQLSEIVQNLILIPKRPCLRSSSV